MRLKEIMIIWRKPNYSEENVKLMNNLNLAKNNVLFIGDEPVRNRIGVVLSKLCACMTDMVTRLMYDVNLPFKKLVIEIWDTQIDDGIKVATGCLGIQDVRIVFSPWSIFVANELRKKKIAIDIIEQAALVFCKEGCSFSNDFLHACNLVKMANYENRWIWKRK